MGVILWYFELFGRFGTIGLTVALGSLFLIPVLAWFIGRALIEEFRLRIWQAFHWREVLEARRWKKEQANRLSRRGNVPGV